MTTPPSDAALTPASQLTAPARRDAVSRTRQDAALTTFVSMTASACVKMPPLDAVLMVSPVAGVRRRMAADVSPRGLAAVKISTPQLKVCISDQDHDDYNDDF